jgi:hypothetical protein
MTSDDIQKLRLISQRLPAKLPISPQDMVSYFGAMQAQDYSMAKWAIGLRCGSSDHIIEDSIYNAEIIRTHILRPTWHFVSASDLRWMLELTAPHVKKLASSMGRKYCLDDKSLLKYYSKMERLLSGNKHLTREEIMLKLNVGTSANNIQNSLIMMNAELDGIVCNGENRGKQFTYALLEERIPETGKISQEESLAKLANKYFTSRGPATLKDFIWWSGLSVTNAKIALELIKPEFQSQQFDNQTYWFHNTLSLKTINPERIYLLPAFDEFLISYKDRTASISAENQLKAFTKNGIFSPILVLNGEVVGTWKRTIKKDKVFIEIKPFIPLIDNQNILSAINIYEKYLGRTVTLENLKFIV